MPQAGSAPLEVTVSPRVRLARFALETALSVPGVVGGDPGPARLRVTADGPGEPLQGVSVTAEPGGSYAVDLCLVAGMVPLKALADQVRRKVRSRVRRAGLTDQLGPVNVEFVDLEAGGG